MVDELQILDEYVEQNIRDTPKLLTTTLPRESAKEKIYRALLKIVHFHYPESYDEPPRSVILDHISKLKKSGIDFKQILEAKMEKNFSFVEFLTEGKEPKSIFVFSKILEHFFAQDLLYFLFCQHYGNLASVGLSGRTGQSLMVIIPPTLRPEPRRVFLLKLLKRRFLKQKIQNSNFYTRDDEEFRIKIEPLYKKLMSEHMQLFNSMKQLHGISLEISKTALEVSDLIEKKESDFHLFIQKYELIINHLHEIEKSLENISVVALEKTFDELQKLFSEIDNYVDSEKVQVFMLTREWLKDVNSYWILTN
ncbi:MAG: hypothetical protein KKF44_01790 [Nanoarchaeota archaeon]|nr:hypothetical protein [Nanoarchaeota archaeon]